MRRFLDADGPDVVPEAAATREAPGNALTGPAFNEYLRIRDYLNIVYRGRWIIIAALIVGVAGGVYYNWRSPRIFEAAATLHIDADPNVLGFDHPLVEQRDWMREFLPTQLAILKSRELANKVREELQQPEGPGSPGLDEGHLPTVGEIVGGSVVSPIPDTRLLSIGFRSSDPVMAARVANALARAYVKWNTDARLATASQASDWLKLQVEEQRRLVQASEAALQRYKEEHGAEALGDRQNVVTQTLGELQAAVTRARTETIEKQTQYQQLVALQPNAEALETLPAIASNPYIQAIKNERAGLQQQLNDASQKLGARHPDIIALRGSVA
jgi:uncharacterized protein involved in exopolysaccharide biosynthesis